jgi:uncharacterized protein (UPF0332 family)
MTDKEALVQYRMSRAKDTLLEALALVELQMWNASLNRLYYACFYAALALLSDNDIETKTHSGVKRMLGLHFIVPGTINEELGSFYVSLFNKRQKGDYEDFVVYEETDVVGLLPQACHFIATIQQMLKIE